MNSKLSADSWKCLPSVSHWLTLTSHGAFLGCPHGQNPKTLGDFWERIRMFTEFAHTFLCPVSGAGLHHRVPFSRPARGRASSQSSATVRSRVGTSAPTAGSWHVLAGSARQQACAVVHLSRVIATPKGVSPSQRVSVAWTTGFPSTSPQVKPTPVRKVRASRRRRTQKGISPREVDLMVDHWAGAHSHWDLPQTKATSVPSLSPGR